MNMMEKAQTALYLGGSALFFVRFMSIFRLQLRTHLQEHNEVAILENDDVQLSHLSQNSDDQVINFWSKHRAFHLFKEWVDFSNDP